MASRDQATSRARTALVLIDVFNRFDYEDGAALAQSTLRILPALRRLRAHFDERRLPVIHANDNFLDWSVGFAELVAACRATPGASSKIAEALTPLPHHYYLLKPRHSAFLGTPLPIMLTDLGINAVVLAGIATDSCILATAQDAKMRDIRFRVPSDATAAATPSRKAAALRVLRTSFKSDTRDVRALLGET